MSINVMKLKELRNDQGLISGLVISAEDIKEFKASLKPDTKFFHYVDDLQATVEEQKRASNQIMPNGLSVAETNKRTAKVTEDLYKNSFSKNVPVFYRDERTTPPDEFVRANPDSSEDLVRYNIEKRVYTVLRPLAAVGKGKLSYLSALE